jgi:multimeric flavodoxin WrbA
MNVPAYFPKDAGIVHHKEEPFMKAIALNGSPRKEWNTATLLNHALQGAASRGAETELIHLYDLDYKGCTSCFACKLIGGSSYGHCAMNDELKPILRKLEEADAIIVGSPIYFGMTTGEVRSFIERLLFQYLVYDGHTTLAPGKKATAFIYTMNVPRDRMEQIGYVETLAVAENAMKRVFGSCEALYANDTYQFADYGKYETSAFSEPDKAQHRKEVFPQDCRNAYELGVKLTSK